MAVRWRGGKLLGDDLHAVVQTLNNTPAPDCTLASRRNGNTTEEILMINTLLTG